jgi:hypothetical protein
MEQLKGMQTCSLACLPLRLKLCQCDTHRVTHTCMYVCGHWPAVCKLYRLRFIGLDYSDHAPGQAINPCTLRPMQSRSPADSGPLQRTGEQRKERQRRKCSPANTVTYCSTLLTVSSASHRMNCMKMMVLRYEL